MKEQPITEYMEQKQDNDNCYYWFIKAEVEWFRRSVNKELNDIFERFEARSEQELYIKGNYLFITLNGVKYYKLLTCSTWEWNHIQELIKEIEPLIEGYYYYRGCLD